MKIGGRIGAQSGWVNPYVTDGLVAMWDGEWNVAPGKHDPNANTWADLCGNFSTNSLYSPIGAFPTWTDRSLALTSTNKGAFWISGVDGVNGYIKLSQLIGDTWTIETCVNRSSTAFANYRGIFGQHGYSQLHGLCIGQYDQGIIYYSTYYGIGITGIGIEDDSNSTIALVDSPTDIVLYKGGVLYDSAINGSISNSTLTRTSNFLIGAAEAGSDRLFEGEIFAIRIYSRALTDTEIATNAAIDKARFFLGAINT